MNLLVDVKSCYRAGLATDAVTRRRFFRLT